MPNRHFGPTRLVRAAALSTPDRDLYLKLESELPTGSFKVRGAVHSLSVNLAKGGIRAVVAASTGNHGAAVAYAARLLDVPAIIFLPANPNPVKAARIRDLGAELIETGADLNAAIDAAREHASSRSHAFFLHDAEDPDIPAGTATIGREIVSQLPSVEAIYVPMGDTALIRGLASAVKELRASTRIIGVVADQAPAYYLSWLTARGESLAAFGRRCIPAACVAPPSNTPGILGRRALPAWRIVALGATPDSHHGPLKGVTVETGSANTIADGLAVRRPLAPNVAAIRELVDDIEAVSEQEMLAAIGRLHAEEQVTAEPAGAAATAAWLKRRDPYRSSVALVTGRNVAPDVMEAVRRQL